jgi:hypothetical protein
VIPFTPHNLQCQPPQPGDTVSGPLLPEVVEVISVTLLGASIRLIGRGLKSGLVRDVVLSAAQVAALVVVSEAAPLDGNAARFRLGIEAQRLGLAHEYDPFFSLSIARVDPLPHKLEAVYDYFL